ncbi:MAG: type II toxin-antitoxin system Phd/YefM family antitoxin [Candidatus Hydrogenedentes bacterium]|nr:type II toxin-antitoxin system Phd/YefM family antitoxin [Candidatus Hydrogenedentota bacterium]
MRSTNIHEAKTHLSRLVDLAAAGEEIIIAKAGKPLAKLVPYHADSGTRQPGFWRGKVEILEGFDALPEDIAAAFRGELP